MVVAVVAGWASAVGEVPGTGVVFGLRGCVRQGRGRRTRGLLGILLGAQLVLAGTLAARLGTGDESLAVDGPLPAKVQVWISVVTSC